MISLLLTLFISMFSYCPSINQLEDHKENITVKSAIDSNDRLYLFTTTYDATNVIGYLCDTYDFFNFSVNNYVDTYFYNQSGGYAKFCHWGHLDIDNWTQSQFDYNLSYVRSTLKSTYYISGANNTSYPAFNVWFEFKDPQGNTFLNYHCDLFANMNSSGQYVYNGYSINYSTSDIYGGWFVVDKETDTFAYNCFRYNDRNFNYERGVNTSQSDAYNEGRQVGYAEGLQAGDDNATAQTIFNGIFEVGLLPVNVFLTIFNFEVFGINIAGLVSSLLTVSIVIIIIRFLFGGKNDDK